MNNSFNGRQQTYTAADVAQVREILKRIGYAHKPEGAYYPEPKFDDCLDDHVKVDASGEMTGIVTLHLDAQNFSGQDGRITVSRDNELALITGRATTVHMFAAMGSMILQRLAPKSANAVQGAIDVKPR